MWKDFSMESSDRWFLSTVTEPSGLLPVFLFWLYNSTGIGLLQDGKLYKMTGHNVGNRENLCGFTESDWQDRGSFDMLYLFGGHLTAIFYFTEFPKAEENKKRPIRACEWSLAEFRHYSAEIIFNTFSGATCACQKTLLAPPVCP